MCTALLRRIARRAAWSTILNTYMAYVLVLLLLHLLQVQVLMMLRIGRAARPVVLLTLGWRYRVPLQQTVRFRLEMLLTKSLDEHVLRFLFLRSLSLATTRSLARSILRFLVFCSDVDLIDARRDPLARRAVNPITEISGDLFVDDDDDDFYGPRRDSTSSMDFPAERSIGNGGFLAAERAVERR